MVPSQTKLLNYIMTVISLIFWYWINWKYCVYKTTNVYPGSMCMSKFKGKDMIFLVIHSSIFIRLKQHVENADCYWLNRCIPGFTSLMEAARWINTAENHLNVDKNSIKRHLYFQNPEKLVFCEKSTVSIKSYVNR